MTPERRTCYKLRLKHICIFTCIALTSRNEHKISISHSLIMHFFCEKSIIGRLFRRYRSPCQQVYRPELYNWSQQKWMGGWFWPKWHPPPFFPNFPLFLSTNIKTKKKTANCVPQTIRMCLLHLIRKKRQIKKGSLFTVKFVRLEKFLLNNMRETISF